jgi:hypothetical protein
MSAGDFVTLVGGIAAILAIWQGLVEAVKWFRRRRARKSFKRDLIQLYDLDRQLAEATAELDYRLTQGVSWTGWAIWPPQLCSPLFKLMGMTDKLDSMRARVRAQWAEGPVERQRDDIEHLVSSLRRATDLYVHGTIDCYRSHGGKRITPSVTGQGSTLVLSDEEARKEVGELRETARLLFRSSAYQLGLADQAKRDDVALWPVRDREAWALQGQYFSETTPIQGADDPV